LVLRFCLLDQILQAHDLVSRESGGRRAGNRAPTGLELPHFYAAMPTLSAAVPRIIRTALPDESIALSPDETLSAPGH
jgi:hypothetical protein